ncbi:MAG: ABC transporter permease, partial [Planctomycetota bacterium]
MAEQAGGGFVRSSLLMASKDLLLLWREPASMFFVFVFPVLFGLLFGAIFSGAGGSSGGMPVGVIDLDGSSRSADVATLLADAGGVEIRQLDDLDAARDLVRRGRLVAVIVVPDAYGETTPFTSAFGPEPGLESAPDSGMGGEAEILMIVD